jgi:uroporphyrinogen-III synthase
LLPCTDILRDTIPLTLEKYNIPFTKAILYRTVAADLSDLEDVYFAEITSRMNTTLV